MNAKTKRRIRDAKRREQERERATLARASEAQAVARASGYADGKRDGAAAIRQHVLDQAGQLYKQGKDSDATAVREAYRKLPASV